MGCLDFEGKTLSTIAIALGLMVFMTRFESITHPKPNELETCFDLFPFNGWFTTINNCESGNGPYAACRATVKSMQNSRDIQREPLFCFVHYNIDVNLHVHFCQLLSYSAPLKYTTYYGFNNSSFEQKKSWVHLISI